MSAPADRIFWIRGRTAEGEPAPLIEARRLSAVVRTIGLYGDDLEVAVPADVWPSGATLDRGGEFEVTVGYFGETITLGGYVVRSVRPITFGQPIEGGATTRQMLAVRLATLPALWRDGRGGSLREGRLNPVDAGGRVIPAGSVENSTLAQMCLDAIGMTADPVPGSVDAFEAPGPIDWSNARAAVELEALLARIGHAARLSNDGASLSIVRLSKAGEALSLPMFLADAAEPYELAAAQAARGDRFIVTSGRTRTVGAITRTLGSAPGGGLEWVWFDARTGRWLNSAETDTLYPGETTPDDIDALRAGPDREGGREHEFNRLFRAVRLPAEVRSLGVRIASLPDAAALLGEEAITTAAATGALAEARAAEALAPGQLRNAPEAAAERAAIEDARVHAEAFVVEFRSPLFTVPEGGGGLGDAEELEGDGLRITALVELATGVHTDDFFVRGYAADEAGAATPLDAEGLADALADPRTVIAEAPFLRRIALWTVTGSGEGASEITPVNEGDLEEVADSFAAARAAAPTALSGVIPIRGMVNVAPGDLGGAVTRVEWDLDLWMTLLTIAQHDEPDSALGVYASRAGRSFAAGVARLSAPGASVAASDIRAGSMWLGRESQTPGAESDQAAQPRRRPGSLGERARSTPGPLSRFLARITGAAEIAANRWRYDWEEVGIDDDGEARLVVNGRTHSTHGGAYNIAELDNDGAGVEGNGVDRASLPEGWTMRPIAERIVEMRGPLGDPAAPFCYFEASNSDDGECPAEEPAAASAPSASEQLLMLQMAGAGSGGGIA